MKDEVKTRERDQANGRDGKSRERRRSPARRDRSRSPVDRSRGKDSTKAARRVYFANVSFDTRWTEIKDFFRDKIGNVTYCQLFEDESGRSRGCGLIEFSDNSSAQRAIDELHKHDFKGRDLVVKEDIDCERDRYGRLITNKKDKDSRDNSHRDSDRIGRQQQQQQQQQSIYDPSRQTYSNSYNTYGLSPQFLESLNITGPLNNRIFVANLDYKVGEKKLEEIFRLAGKVLRVRLYTDQGGTSKGHGTVEFEHPVEAVQAISMFHDQNLYGRAMSIRMDKYEPEEMPEVLPSKLPSGLESIGKGLGIGGQPLNIGKSLSTSSLGGQPSASGVLAQSNPTLAAAQTVAAPVTPQPQLNSYSLSGLTSALGQQNVGLNPTLSSLSTPQVNQATLSSFGLHNLNASSLSGLGNQNLTQLANTAQNVLQNVALSSNSLNPSLNPSLGQLTSAAAGPATSGLFSSYDRDSYQTDKFRNGGGVGSMVNSVQSPSNKILVRNLPASFSLQNIKDRFNEFGRVEHVSPLNRNMALVVFSNYADASSAVNMMNGLRIGDKVLEVSFHYNGSY